MEFFNSDFYRNSLKVHEELKTKKLLPTTFPTLDFLTDGDKFFKSLWKTIDEAQTYVWLMTYYMDDTYTANLTFNKLIEASKRGVKVVLMIDDMNYRVNPNLKKELEKVGGIVHRLNEIRPYFKTLNLSREMFHRHHEKLAVIDNMGYLGSANIADNYSGYLYGENRFYDLNMVVKNLCLNEMRKTIVEAVSCYNLRMDNALSNEEVLAKYENMYKDSLFNLNNVRLLKSVPPAQLDIQNFIIENIYNAKKSIYIIQPYYYKVRAFEKAVLDALSRGVHVEIITAHKRDQWVYASLKNMLLMKNMVSKGLKVYEYHDKLLHMKSYLFDDKLYTLGSFNNDRWSWKINKELNIVVEGEEESKKLMKIHESVRENSKRLDPSFQLNWYRYIKMKFWEQFLFASEQIMSKQRQYDVESRLREYKRIKERFEKERHQTDEKVD